MRRVTLALSLLAGLASAQQYIDPFGYAPGTLIPGYTEQRGNWIATGTTVQSQLGATFQELTFDTFADRDACVETVAIYDTVTPGLMYTGPIVRHNGAGAASTYFMVKLQDNGVPRDGFDTYWVYYYNGASHTFVAAGSNGTIAPPALRVRARLQVIEEAPNVRVQIFLDTNLDGTWEISREWLSLLGVGTAAGKIGVAGYQNAIADDLKYFNANLWLSGTPQVGMPVNLKGRATSGFGYLGACSLGHSGIPLGDGRVIPLDLDALFLLSLTTPVIFSNFTGVVDANGDFTMTLNTPAVPELAGFTIWSSAITFTPNGVIEIAPDVQITFVP
jgi:hypothetical protein